MDCHCSHFLKNHNYVTSAYVFVWQWLCTWVAVVFIKLSVLSNNSWRTRPHFIEGELLQTDRTGTATAIFFPTIKFPITQFHIILYICKYPCVIMCHQIRFEGSELSWQLSWDRAPVFSEWPSGGDTSRMSISRLRTTTWNSKLSWPKSRDWGDPKMSYNRWPGCKPIEHIWDVLGHAITIMDNPPQNPSELRQSLLDKWAKIRFVWPDLEQLPSNDIPCSQFIQYQ